MSLSWYEDKIEAAEEPDFELLQESVYHALCCDQLRSAYRNAIDLSFYINMLFLHYDKLALQQTISDRVTDSVLSEAKEEKDGNVSILLNSLRVTYHDLGGAEKALAYYQQALKIFKSIYSDDHPATQTVFENIYYLIRELSKGEWKGNCQSIGR
jgi:tetratricopeptide (TPR) repeat protein